MHTSRSARKKKNQTVISKSYADFHWLGETDLDFIRPPHQCINQGNAVQMSQDWTGL
jgi:hypothetical protein